GRPRPQSRNGGGGGSGRRRAGSRRAGGRPTQPPARPVRAAGPARPAPAPAPAARRSRGRAPGRTGRRHRSGAGKAGPSLADSSVRPGPPAAAGPAGSHEKARLAAGFFAGPGLSARPGGGSPGWIRTTECLSQSQVPYHLATGLWDRLVAPSRGDGAGTALTLRELGGAAGLVQADLLALDLARVAGHEP